MAAAVETEAGVHAISLRLARDKRRRERRRRSR